MARLDHFMNWVSLYRAIEWYLPHRYNGTKDLVIKRVRRAVRVYVNGRQVASYPVSRGRCRIWNDRANR